LLATFAGLLKTTKDKLIRQCFKENEVRSLCHISDSIYLIGVYKIGLIVWDEQNNLTVFRISENLAFSIKRVMTTNNYIIKDQNQGVKILTIDDLKS
jgi:hypothetical protein